MCGLNYFYYCLYLPIYDFLHCEIRLGAPLYYAKRRELRLLSKRLLVFCKHESRFKKKIGFKRLAQFTIMYD